MSGQGRSIEYEPPSPDVLDHFAFDVCHHLGEGYNDPDVMRGFAGFLKVMSQTLANQLNRKGGDELDTRVQ